VSGSEPGAAGSGSLAATMIPAPRRTPHRRPTCDVMDSDRVDRRLGRPHSFVAFAIVGGIEFLVDAAVLAMLFHGLGINVYSARVASFGVGATSTWWFNRRWTFRLSQTWRSSWENVRYFSVNGVGFIVNFFLYVSCIRASAIMASHPVFAATVGSVGGLLFTYFGSRRFPPPRLYVVVRYFVGGMLGAGTLFVFLHLFHAILGARVVLASDSAFSYCPYRQLFSSKILDIPRS
jgi:putative flippase GtrA